MAGKFRTNKAGGGGGTEFYETDPDFFKIVNYEFNFKLDAAASADNAKCDNFFTKEDNSLTKEWIKYGSIWLNPPYSRGVVNEFTKKSCVTGTKGATVVMLLHTCPDVGWWYDWIWGQASEVRHLKGRLNFWFGNSGNKSDLPHSLIIYRPRNITGVTHQIVWDWRAAYFKYIGPIPVRNKKTREIIYYTDDKGNKVHIWT